MLPLFFITNIITLMVWLGRIRRAGGRARARRATSRQPEPVARPFGR